MGWCSQDLSAVLNAVARFRPWAALQNRPQGPPSSRFPSRVPLPISLFLGTAPREVGTGLLILGWASLSRAGTLVGGRQQGLGSRSGAGASLRAPSPAPGLCSSPYPVPPKCARGRRLEQAEERGGEGGDLEGGAQLGAGMDAEYPAFEPPLCNGLKQLCQRLQEAYRELKEDLAPFKDDRYYR